MAVAMIMLPTGTRLRTVVSIAPASAIVEMTSPDPTTIATNDTRITPGSPSPRFFEIQVAPVIIPRRMTMLQAKSAVSKRPTVEPIATIWTRTPTAA